MFLKPIVKHNKSTGGYTMQYRLCESYRFDNGVRHQTIVHLGTLDELPGIEQKKALARRLDEMVKNSRNAALGLFRSDDEVVETLAQKYFAIIKEKERLDIAQGKDYQRVDTDSVENKNIREVGTEWLCMQALEQLNIPEFLDKNDWDSEEIKLALTHIISRAAYPASELRTSKWMKRNSAVCQVTAYPLEKITKDKLYGISHRLYEVKDELEEHLSKRTNELFGLEDKIIIYDLTNTYYEGKMQGSVLAKYGRSKEKRSDAKIVVLAVVVNAEGFLKYSQIFEGNMSDSASLGKIIKQLSERTASKEPKPTVVLDAGIATDDNIKLLKENKYNYICVSRSGMKKYTVDAASKPMQVFDKKEQPITLQKVKMEGCTDNYVCVHSLARQAKETGMNSRFSQRFEEGLTHIKEGISKKGGIKKQQKVWERIGRLKAKYSSIHKYYNIEVKVGEKDIATDIKWSQKTIEKQEGNYLLRTNLNENDEHTKWTIYNTIREIEATFRVLKTDLDLRPIYHKTDAAAMAHLHLGLLAYWAVNTIGHQLKQKGIKNEWRDIVRIMKTQKLVTTTMENDCEQQIIIRQFSKPEEQVKEIYDALKYKTKPLSSKKSVVPLKEFSKKVTIENQGVLSG
ncbi:MAG TPA: IS1634 family transposase [Segetibacter sp.]